MKLAIIGNTTKYSLIQKSLADLTGVDLVISTGAQDKESLTKRWAQERELQHIEFIENLAANEMLIKICSHVVIFGEVGNLVDLAKKYKKRYRIITAIDAVKS